MTSLSAHLRDPDAHGALQFHADCPICRSERLLGSPAVGGRTDLTARAGRPRRQRAGAEHHRPGRARRQTGLRARGHRGGHADRWHRFLAETRTTRREPGGAARPSTNRAAEPGAGGSAGNDDSGPVEQQPATNTNDPVVDNGDGADAGQPQTQPSPQQPPTQQPATVAADQTATQESTSDTSPPQATPTDAGPWADPTATTTAPTDSTTTADQPSTAGSAHSAPTAQRPWRRPSHLPAPNIVHHPRTVSGGAAAPAAPAPAALSAPAPVTTPAATTAAAVDAKPGDRIHRVHAGESLWSIASDMLGPSAMPARIAGEVHRLWQLNRERIATGNPDLLMVGTPLRLQ